MRALLLCVSLVLPFAIPALAGTESWINWNANSNTSNDWGVATSWVDLGGSGGNHAPFSGDTGFITNAVNANVTNTVWRNADWNAGGIVVSNNSSGINKLVLLSNMFTFNTAVVGNHGIFDIGNGASLQVNNTMSLNAGGTLLLNGGSFINRANDFDIRGTVFVNSGTYDSGIGTGGSANHSVHVLSGGQIIANSGTAYFNPADAFSNNGMLIDSGGTVQINSGATFVLNRTANAWNTDGIPNNNGNIFLNGGTFTLQFAGSQASDRPIINNGTILGSGTLAMQVQQSSTGQTIASNGVLNIFQTVASNQQTFTASGGQFGVMKAVSGGNLKINGNVANTFGASWVVNAGGTVEVAGVSVDLSTGFIPGSQLNGSVRVDSGGNLTLSGNTGASGQTIQQNGTFEFNVGSSTNAQIFMANVSGMNAFTNAGTFVLNGAATGSATFQGGVAGGNGYGLVNSGTILASSGGTLIINSVDATTLGFSNTASGTMIITNGSLLRIDRTATGWTGAQAVNMGTMILSNATFQTATGGTLDQGKLFKNAGTILVQGSLDKGTNIWQSTLLNAGTILITNNNAVLTIGTSSTVNQLTNTATGFIFLGTNGASGSLVATNVTQFDNLGTIQGQGTITLGRNSATGGQNARLINAGTIIATNYGGAGGGTLFISTGDARTSNGFANASAGSIYVGTNMTLVLNRSSGAWGGASLVTNAGTVFMQGGTFATASDGTTDTTAARTNINTGLITGWGAYQWSVSNVNAQILADARGILNRNTGTLTVSLLSFTNGAGTTLGSIGTNTTLLLGVNNSALLNFGVIQLSAGQIVLSNTVTGTTGGSITNFATIAGVGNVSSFPIVQAGANSSLIATTPTDGSNNLIATVGSINSALLGTVSNASGVATLQLTLSGGATVLSNAGTIAMQGGALTVNGTSGVISNTGLIFGFGGLSNNVANVTGGTILASNGALRVGALNNANAGVLSNFNASATLLLTNTILRNTGTIALNGGGLIMGGSTITNDGTIIGPGNYSSGLYNATDGTVLAQNGTLAIATNGAAETVQNLGTFSIGNTSTLSVGSAWNNTNGLVSLSGGTLAGSAVTNKGAITGNGTITSVLNNLAGGTLTASGGTLTIVQQPAAQSGNMAIVTGGTLAMAMPSGTFTNGGTINSSGGLMVFNNSFTGTFQNNGVVAGFGTNSLDTVFSAAAGSGTGRNPNFINAGLILASNGLFMINAADSFTQGGFSNVANGTVAVSNGATFAVNKTANYWVFGSALANQGTVAINGGTVTLYYNGAETNGGNNANIAILNNGTILAQGTGTATNTWGSGLLNAGTIYVTNNNSVFNVLTMNAVTNTASGQILLGGNGAVGTLIATNAGQNGNSLANQGTLEGEGTITLGVNNDPRSSGASAHLLNSGTLIATNWGNATPGSLFISTGNAFSGGGFENLSSGSIQIATNMTLTINRTYNAWANSGNAVTNLGVIAVGGGTLNFAADGIQSNAAGFINNGTITGSGFIVAGVTNAALGTIAPSSGTLTIDGSGGFGNSGTLVLNTGNTLLLTNLGAVSGLTFSNAGTIQMSGGQLLAGIITNGGTISGFGTIDGGGVANGGTILASNLTANAATLTVRLSSYTNASTASIGLGVIGTNTVLDIHTPGNVPFLINLGTVNLSGGQITNSLAGGFTITNFDFITGVGNLSSLPVVNTGATASIVAQLPVQGISNLFVSIGLGGIATNGATLGANNSGGAATLSLSVGNQTTDSLYNRGTINLNGGFIKINSGAGGVTNLSGGVIFGNANTESNLTVANLSGGTVMASNGTLRLGMIGPNAGLLSNFNSAATIVLTNTVLVNSNNIALNGGGLIMGGSTITNEGTINGPGNYSSGLYNDTTGTVVATGGTLAIATNGAVESVSNLGTFTIANASTLNVAPAWNNNNGGQVLIGNTGGGGNLAGGTITNSGTILGQGTISPTVVNLAGGTVKATNGVLALVAPNSTLVLQGTMIGGTAPGSYIAMTNNTGGAVVNNGTMVLAGSGNLGFYVLNNFTNASGATIRGAGAFQTGDGALGGANWNVYNAGSILATNGSLVVDLGDAFLGGFNNLSGGTVTVANASSFGLARTANAWNNAGTNPVNNGAIILNGGSLQTYDVTGTGPGGAISANNARGISNAVNGIISGSGTIAASPVNLGAITATNGNLNIDNGAAIVQSGTINIAGGATLTVVGNAGSFQNNAGAQMLLSGGTFVGTNFAIFKNQGTISGFGTIQTGRLTGNAGANQNMVNFGGGTIVATNGTLFLNPGDAFADGGFSNSSAGAIIIANNGTLALNRTANAWNNYGIFGNATNSNPKNRGTINLQGGSFVLYAEGLADASRFIDNVDGTISGFGTISGSVSNLSGGTIRATGGTLALQGTGRFLQAGTLQVDGGATMLVSNVNGLASLSNAGTILMNGGTLLAGTITNANWIYGNGSITGNVSSGVINLSNSFLFASNGVLSASLGSFTNGIGVTMGTLSTNATLDVQMPGGPSQTLFNQGTLSFAGGTLLANGTGNGIITNLSGGIILGVGNVTQTVGNNGTILAANPVSGLNIFSVGLSEFSSGTIGASNGAILNVVLGGGAGSSFNNNGSISMIGGTLIISNGTPGVISNLAAAFVTGVGTVMPNIVNLALGTVQATVSNGILDVSLSTTNAGFLRAGSGATLTIENGSFVNTGTIGAVGSAGGTIQMAATSAVITNNGLITGFGGLAVNGFVQNVTGGRISATNGVLAFNAINGLANTGTIDVQNSGTFQSNSSNSWSNAGSIDLRGGTLRTGGFTNASVVASFTNTASGVIDGYGTLLGGGAYGQSGPGVDKSIINFGTIIATNPLSGTAQTLYVSTGGATTGGGIQNLGNMIVSSNNTLTLDRGGLPVLNTGTITINNGTLSSTSTITNTLNGIIQGYGTLTASIVNQLGGTIRATNGEFAMTSKVFPINQGTFEINDGATLTWDATNTWVNAGTIDMRGGTLRTGGTTNTPPPAGPFPGEPFTNAVNGTIIGRGTIIGGGAFDGSGSGYDKSIANLGTVIASNGVLTLNTGVATANRGLANLGTMIVATTNDTLQLLRTAEITGTVTNLNYVYNSGTILINGGTLTSNTSITNNDDSLSQPGLVGLIQGFGTIALTNQLVNLGTIRSTNTVAGGDGVLRFVNPSGSALQINQSGTLVVEDASQMIFGSDSNAPVVNAGTIIMRGGVLRSGMLTNKFGATLEGFGTNTSSIINSGTLLATSVSATLHLTGSTVFNQTNGVLGANHGRLLVDTVFTNAGTVSFLNSVGTFASAVVNQGAWVMDPSTNVFLGNYTVATNGYLSMASGDVNIFKSNFVNVSTLSNQYNTLNGKFVMDGQGTQKFFVAGINLGGFASSIQASNEIFFTTGSGTFSTNGFSFANGDAAFGYSNNFALGTLELSGLSTTVLYDAFGTVGSNDNKVAGLYLDSLTLDPGSLLIISNNVELYFHSTNGVTGIGLGTLGAGDNVLILDGGSFHQLTVVPEPSILMLLSIGAFAIVGYRRRKAKLPAKR